MKNKPFLRFTFFRPSFFIKRIALPIILAIALAACSSPIGNTSGGTNDDSLAAKTDSLSVQKTPAKKKVLKRKPSRAELHYLIDDSLEQTYDLYRPSKKFKLPYTLETVSGLEYVEDDILAMIEDEGGRLYEYDINKGKLLHSIAFSEPGDFEGVAYALGDYWAIKSNGSLYRFERTSEERTKPKKIKTPFTYKNNIEGLTYDPVKDRLLIATKQSGDIKGRKAKGKAVYAFNYEKNKIKRKPVIEVSQKKLLQFFEDHRNLEYDPSKVKFKPSGVAVHPINNYYYVLASTGKLLVVFDRDGQIIGSYAISPKILIQPEGICFAPDGTLYLASEGQGENGYVIRFNMKTK